MTAAPTDDGLERFEFHKRHFVPIAIMASLALTLGVAAATSFHAFTFIPTVLVPFVPMLARGTFVLLPDGLEVRHLGRLRRIPFSALSLVTTGKPQPLLSLDTTPEDRSSPSGDEGRRAPWFVSLKLKNGKEERFYLAKDMACRLGDLVSSAINAPLPDRALELNALDRDALGDALRSSSTQAFRGRHWTIEQLAALACHPTLAIQVRVAAANAIAREDGGLRRELRAEFRQSAHEEIRALAEEITPDKGAHRTVK